jgi:thiamine biosynthesis lipoprotein ApbE
VIHQDAELADASATALMVAGAGRFLEVARLMGIDTAMLVTSEGDIIMTPAMTARIREPVQKGGTEAGIM